MTREELKDRARSEWRSFYAADKGKGSKAGIICPICGNGTGESGTGITENPRKPGNLTCFKCGFQGDIIDLLQKDKATDYNGALAIAADVLGVTIDTEGEAYSFTGSKHQAEQHPAPLDEVPANYIPYYRECCTRLFETPAALEYIHRRGISDETARAFWLGYDPAWRSPTAIKRGNTPPSSPRIILQCTRSQYEARAINGTGGKFDKMNEGGKALFNAYILDNPTYNNSSIFITEGIFDALSVIEAGGLAIALNSTANAEKLLEKLEAAATPTKSTIILCLDNDQAGQSATEKLERGLSRLNISNIRADICNGHKDPNEALTADRSAFIEAVHAAQRAAKGKPDNIADYIAHTIERDIEQFKAARNKNTGFPLLDNKSGGLFPGLYVIAAISSLGKTTFTAQIADQLAEAGEDVLFFSLEMSRLELVTKSIARRAYISDGVLANSSLSYRRGYYETERKAFAAQYAAKVGDRMNIIEGNFNCNISFIGSYVRSYVDRTGTRPTVIIDYLQILQAESANAMQSSTKQSVDMVITELKRLSRELNITVIAISSVNRANYLTPIDFESLKESGGIEYTADVIWGLQLACLSKDPVFDEEKAIKKKRAAIKGAKAESPRKIELVCLKNRYGIANFSVYFDYHPAHDYFIEDTKSNSENTRREEANTRKAI